MSSIDSLPPDVLLMIFKYLPTVRDICAASQVCKRWRQLSKNESIPFCHQRLERIVFENIHRFDQLPRVRLELQLKDFTIFQDKIVGKTESGDLCIYDPKTNTTCSLNHKPRCSGRFLTSSQACVYRATHSHWYQLDADNRTCEELELKMNSRNSYALLGKKIFGWENRHLHLYLIRDEVLRGQRPRNPLLPCFDMQIYDLEDRSFIELTFRARFSFGGHYTIVPEIRFSGDKMLLIELGMTKIFNSNLQQCEKSTFFQATHLLGKKLLHRAFNHITTRDVGDARNYRDKVFELPEVSFSKLHPFFIENIGWRFLQFDGIYCRRVIWFLEKGSLTYLNFIQDL